jgi:hypothetical protein
MNQPVESRDGFWELKSMCGVRMMQVYSASAREPGQLLRRSLDPKPGPCGDRRIAKASIRVALDIPRNGVLQPNGALLLAG